MLLKAPIHNLTLSLICRFEVNCLHINPIIGEILLICINFQQNFPYFSSYDNFYCIEICLPTAYFTSSRCVLKRGLPKFGLFFSKRPAGFHCRKRPSPTFTNIWSHCPWALQSAATVECKNVLWDIMNCKLLGSITLKYLTPASRFNSEFISKSLYVLY